MSKNYDLTCFYTFLTTVVAFLSLIISDIKPIDFGYIMIIALNIILLISFTILPLFISFFTKEKSKLKINLNLLKNIFFYTNKYNKFIIIINFHIFNIDLWSD